MNIICDKETSINQERENFEQLYAEVRKKEKRLYGLKQVAVLPQVKPNHIYHAEWKMRKISCHRLINYLKKKNRHLKILEIGCGNGWLSNKIAFHVDAEVIGVDINKIELAQARTIWSQTIDLDFIHGDIRDDLFHQDRFDIILFAASIQYFSSINEILTAALSLLNKSGEIHIIDSNFYKAKDLNAASERTDAYYTELGFPEMSAHYFHHSWEQLSQFNYRILYNPGAFINIIKGNKNVFPWIKITK